MERCCVLMLCFSIAFASTALAISTDAGFYSRRLKFEIHRHGNSRSSTSESSKKMKLQIHERLISKPQMKFLTVNSPFSLPPFDSLGPTPLPEISPPFCEDAPPAPPPPAFFQPNVPTRSQKSPPPSPTVTPLGPLAPYPPVSISSPTPPPSTIPITPIGPLAPYPPVSISSPTPPPATRSQKSPPPSTIPITTPIGYPPPTGPPSPPQRNGPSPPKHASGPPVFLPPMVFPGPPPAAHGGKPKSTWCVAKPTVPDPIIQEALDYACGSGADCKSIQPNGHCYDPDTILAHASYAFNSYWQNTKVTGGTCDFGGTAMLVTVDPSFEGCKFVLN